MVNGIHCGPFYIVISLVSTLLFLTIQINNALLLLYFNTTLLITFIRYGLKIVTTLEQYK